MQSFPITSPAPVHCTPTFGFEFGFMHVDRSRVPKYKPQQPHVFPETSTEFYQHPEAHAPSEHRIARPTRDANESTIAILH